MPTWHSIVAVDCAKRPETTSTSTTATTSQAETATVAAPPTTSAAAPTSSTIASATYSLDPNLRADLLEVKRVSGGALLVKWRIVAAGGDKPIHYDFAWTDLYYVDPAENKKYGYLSDSEGNKILDI